MQAGWLTKTTGCSGLRASLWEPHVASAMAKFHIDETPLRMSAFLAQIAHESGLFSIAEENLNYSADGLVKVFSKYFTKETAPQYAKQPIKIANKVYGGRMGNGDEATGDGWTFRGRGLIQLTGKTNYTACGQGLGIDLATCPDLLGDPAVSAQAAGWFWDSRKLSPVADVGDFEKVTRLINGGLNGMSDRMAIYERAKKALGVA